MKEKALKRLSRSELLELLLVQTREAEQMAEELNRLQKQLADRRLRLEAAGDIAHAVLEVNGVMEAAQEAARQYLDNIARMEAETKERCEKMLRDARQAAQRIIQEAKETAVAPEQETVGGIPVLLKQEK